MKNPQHAVHPRGGTIYHSPTRVNGTVKRLVLLSGLLTAFALRLLQLGTESLWYDETVSVVLARKSLPDLIAHTAGDIHPPGYYILLHFWQVLVQPTLAHGLEFLFAWPSLWFGILIVALLYPLGRHLFGPTTALLGLWLAALHPYQIWYSQEVRMYTLGALLGLLCLWALINYLSPTNPTAPPLTRWRWLLLYAFIGVLALYTLYYFLFLLAAFNVIVLLLLWLSSREYGTQALQLTIHWLVAQLLIILLWLPWLPIFWRQITEPPVPPWRVPWDSFATFLQALSESISALLVGQSAPIPTHWLWLLMGIMLFAATGYIYAKQVLSKRGTTVVAAYTLGPLLSIFLVTLFITPIYHVRYLILYAPPLMLLMAHLFQSFAKQYRNGALLLLGILVLVNGWSLHAFWTAPRFQADDHRSAVAQVAEVWRPGDLILVNAGWIYTALATYWPTELIGVDAALSPEIATIERVQDYAHQIAAVPPDSLGAPVLVRTGSVDGVSTLGWGNPTSDFFAISGTETTEALAILGQRYRRIWHYRLYDTVNDPDAVVRAWLEGNGDLLLDQPIAGRDFLRLQLYQLHDTTTERLSQQLEIGPTGLTLQGIQPLPTMPAAGQTFYLQSRWLLTDPPMLPEQVSFSLRLYDEQGQLWAQQDETPFRAVQSWHPNTTHDLTLALPIPVATPPGAYQLQLVLYNAIDGATLPLVIDAHTTTSFLTLGDLTVAPAVEIPEVDGYLARFDYIELLLASLGRQGIQNGESLQVTVVWRPRPNLYRDTYLAQWQLRDVAGTVVQQWEEVLGSWAYPSGVWHPAIPVRQQAQLSIDPALASGRYRFTMQVVRQQDGFQLPAHLPWSVWGNRLDVVDDTLWLDDVVIED